MYLEFESRPNGGTNGFIYLKNVSATYVLNGEGKHRGESGDGLVTYGMLTTAKCKRVRNMIFRRASDYLP